jgi:hypothetical protein
MKVLHGADPSTATWEQAQDAAARR